MKVAVIYKSKYGATKQYAEWIAEDLDCSIFEHSQIKQEELSKFDLIIYGGSLFADMISGVGFVKKYKSLIIFTVGLSSENPAYLERIIKGNSIEDSKFFYFRGELDESKLTLMHKLGMKVFRSFISKKKEKTEDDEVILSSAGKKVSFIDRGSIKPLVDYVKSKQ